MGANTSKAHNLIESAISMSIQASNDATQNCYSQSSDTQSMTICGNDVHIGNISMDQRKTVDVSCMMHAQANTDIKAKINQQMEQLAKAVTGMAPGISNSESDNITRTSAALGIAIANSFSQSCGSAVAQQQEINVDCAAKGVHIGYISLKQAADVTTKCVQESAAVNKAKGDLENAIKQSAIAKAGSMMELVILIAVIFLGLIGLFAFGGKEFSQTLTKTVTNPYLLTAVGIGLASYMGLAYKFNWSPFDTPAPPAKDEPKTFYGDDDDTMTPGPLQGF